MKLGKIFGSCLPVGASKGTTKIQPVEHGETLVHGARGQESRTYAGLGQLRARRQPVAANSQTNATPAPRKNVSAPRAALQRLFGSKRAARADEPKKHERAEFAAGQGGGPRPAFDLRLDRGKVLVRSLHPTFSKEQARQLERQLNDKRDPVTGLTWSPVSHGYTITYKNGGKRRWLGTAGSAMPVVALAPHHAAEEVKAPPPIGLIADVCRAADGSLWRLHSGELYQWNEARTEWQRVETPNGGRTPVELIGRQLDGHAWARSGTTLLKLGADGYALPSFVRYPHVRIGKSGEQFALDSEGRLCRPDEPASSPRSIALQLSDGRVAFEPIQLGKPQAPVKRAVATDFQLAPDGRTMFVRDHAGHLYQADIHGAGTESGEIVARRVVNPMREPGIREGWRADALTIAPGKDGQTSALHAVFSSSHGQRVAVLWDGSDWKPQFHVEQPLLLLSDQGLEAPDIAKVVDHGNGVSLGISRDGHAYLKDGERGWRPLLQADGQPMRNLVDLKLGPAGLSDAKAVYAKQQDADGRARIVKLGLGGQLARLPARSGAGAAALPAGRRVSGIGVLAETAKTPMLDFAVDGKGVAYYLTGDRQVFSQPPGSEAQPLPRAPGLARIEQIAVSGDGNQLFALARGPLRHGDNPAMPTLLRYDRETRSWVNCHINVSWDEPLHLSISNLGTLQLAVDKRDGTRETHRVLPPVGNAGRYRLQKIAQGEASVAEALTGTVPKRLRIPGTGAFATVSQARAGVTEWGKGRFNAAIGHAERVLTMPKGAAERLREQKNGRDDMAVEYEAMRTMQADLDRLLLAEPFPLSLESSATAYAQPVADAPIVQTCVALRGGALDGMLAELQRIGVRSGVLGPDLRLTASAEKQKQAASAGTPDARDLLPRMTQWLASMERSAQINAHRAVAFGDGKAAPLLGADELDRVRQVLTLMSQLSEHGVILPAADLSLQRDTGNSMAVLTGALGRHLLTFDEATRLVSAPGSTKEGAEAAASVDVAVAAAALKQRVTADKVLQLARFGFSGWEDAEAYREVVASFRQEVAKPRAPLSRKLQESLAIKDVGHVDELAVKLAEAMKGLSNRSTLFGIESRGASVGATVSGAVFTRGVAWGFLTLGIDSTTMVGVERTGDRLEEGPLVAFFVRQVGKNVSVGSGVGFDPKPINAILGTHLQAQAQATASLMRGKGAALLVAPEHIDEFCRRLCDPNEDPARILEIGLNGGAIGLDMREHQLTVGVSAGGMMGASDPIPSFGPASGTSAHAFKQSALQRGFVGTGVNWTVRDFMLKLQHAWEPISGLEYQGGSGWTANAFASLVQQGALLPHVSDAFTLALRSLNVTLLGATVEWSGVESYKRTLDWKAAAPVEPREWNELAALAKEVFPSQVIGHLGGPRFKETVAAMLQDARTTWSARSEHERADFVNRAEQLLLQDACAEKGCAMLVPGAKIEINIPNVDALEKARKDSKAHRSLGPVMEASVRAQESIPGLAGAMKAMAALEGTNDTRFVFQMDPGYINAVNRQMLEGTMSWDEFNVLARTMPAPYRLTEICAKDSDTNRSALSINPLPVVVFNDSGEASRSLFTAEVQLRYGLDGGIIGCDMLPSAQRAARDQPLLRPFAKQGIFPVSAADVELPPQAPDLPKLRRSQSASEPRGSGVARPFSSRIRP